MAQTPPTFARPVKNAVYDTNTLSWVPMTQPEGGVGGGGLTDAELRATPVDVQLVGGALTASSPTAATVGASSAQAVASNANRAGLVLVNTSVNRISIAFGATAVLDSGITLYPQGTYCMGPLDFTTAAVNAIASAASSNLAIQEFS
jgi:hypothetical protein